ncbi:MAG: hypothetical protein CMB74_03820 [Euryarchaeota archaeon]|nr:hypothetical protein [Euryarchaeota archaeon]|tara:strand:+ start:1433 stop:2122 length:690 start_codon:yes stop_codon:yes gene_type:complete
MIFQSPKPPLTDLNATDIVRQAKEERQACHDRLSARIEKKLEGRVSSFLKLHKIDYHIRQAANHGLNEVRISIQPKFRGAFDLSEPIDELCDAQFNIRVMYNHNAFFKALETHVFKEDHIDGHIVFARDDDHQAGKAREIFITWEALMPSPLTLDFLWDANYTVSEFVENETIGAMIERLDLRPRDGTPLVVRNGRRRVGPNSQVSTYFGKTLTLRPEGIENNPQGIDL